MRRRGLSDRAMRQARLPAFQAPGGRYTATAQVLHWIVAVLMLAAVAVAWTMVLRTRTDPGREIWYTLHKSIGLTILALVAVRLAWRATHPAPPLPPRMAGWEKGLAHASHWLLYAILVAMPVSGYLQSSAGGHTTQWFWLFDVPDVPASPSLARRALQVHLLGQWAVYGLFVLHVAGTAWHVAVRRDGALDRMLPAQDGE